MHNRFLSTGDGFPQDYRTACGVLLPIIDRLELHWPWMPTDHFGLGPSATASGP